MITLSTLSSIKKYDRTIDVFDSKKKIESYTDCYIPSKNFDNLSK